MPVKVKPESRSDDGGVDPLTVLRQHLCTLQQQQQSVTSLQQPAASSSSSSSSSSWTGSGTACSDVGVQQLQELQRQLLLMHGLPTIMSTTICQPGSSILVCSTCSTLFGAAFQASASVTRIWVRSRNTVALYKSFFTRDSTLCLAQTSCCNSVRPSVRLSRPGTE